MNPAAPAPVATVDAQNPWLGLVSFTEETRTYFHGREEEVAELGRRVQRKLLTVLFGQSGLGKTSILQAGLVPRLRPDGFCPVYVRLDYDPRAPAPAEQIKRALFAATQNAGTWTRTGSAVAGESLWEFLHHRDDVLKDPAGQTLVPILIFDQFEEIFTLAQTDEAGRRRAHDFLGDLADLVENRPPAALEARIDRDEADAARFDFARADYRILISLREDYLAHLEGLKGQMPSVTQNRMRLARMTGAQAVAAVRAPAPALVSEPVAEAIVRFVSGGTDLAHAEVEPSLLSLICRELNTTRLAQGRAEISADLLAGSRHSILAEFYERALADQPPGVRTFVEDEMLTESGFRESVAEERVQKAFTAAGSAPEALATLVNRRLLRVEDRLDLRRVEITHDVLCSVIGASRSVRHEREALEATQRQLAAQEERERATRRALVRARAIAAVSAVLMVVAIASATFGWINLRRARVAEQQTQEARAITEKARTEAEKLVGFLLEDFYIELQPTGRLEIVGKLADQAVAYYDGLPPELVNHRTRLYRGMALVRKASAQITGSNVNDGYATAVQARDIFAQLQAEGESSEAVTVGLALAHFNMGTAGVMHRNPTDLRRAADLLRPLIASGHASRSAKLALADALNFLSHEEPEWKQGVADSEEARKVLADMGALDLTDLSAASIYGDVSDTESRIVLYLGESDRARELATQVAAIAGRVLEKRPGDLRAMKDEYLAPDVLSQVADENRDLPGSMVFARQSYEAAMRYIYFNPADFEGWFSASVASNTIAEDLYQQGHVAEALGQWKVTTALETDPHNVSHSWGYWYYAWIRIGQVAAQSGRLREAEAAFAEEKRLARLMEVQQGADQNFVRVIAAWERIFNYDILAHQGNYADIFSQAAQTEKDLEAIQPNTSVTRNVRDVALRRNAFFMAEAALRVGQPEVAETTARNMENALPSGRLNGKQREDLVAQAKIALGRALIARGQNEAGMQTLQEALAYERRQLAAGAVSTQFRHDYALVLYHLAIVQPKDEAGTRHRQSLLAEAASQMGGLSTAAQVLDQNRELLGQIADAQKP